MLSNIGQKDSSKSTVHRVVMPILNGNNTNSNNERFSIAFFCHLNHLTLLKPIPSKLIVDRIFGKDAHTKHVLDHDNEQVLTAGEHLQMRLNKTYSY